MKQISLIYMVAGLSSRFGGKAKGLCNVGPKGEKLLEYSLNQALKNKFHQIILIVGKNTKSQYYEHFGDSYKDVPIVYVVQTYDENIRERPWGTNDALCSARNLIDGPFIVCNGDDIYGENAIAELYRHLQENSEDATIGYKLGKVLSDVGGVNRGIFDIENGYLKTVIETLGITRENMKENGLNDENLCSMNLFGLQKSTLNMLDSKLEKFKIEHKGDDSIECYLPAQLNSLIDEGKIKMKLYETDDLWIGVTSPADEEVVRDILAKL